MAVLGSASFARAESAEAAKRRAADLAERGRQLFEAGHPEEAIAVAEEAYRASPEPLLLYNIARGYEQLGELAKATQAYRRYLDAQPGATARPAILQRIATLQRLIDERERVERDYERRLKLLDEERAAILRAAPSEVASPLLPAGVTFAAVGLAAAGVGATLWAIALSRHADAGDPSTSGVTTVSDQAAAAGLARAGNVTFAIGGVLAAGGAVAAIVAIRRRRADATPTAWAPIPVAGRGWLGLRAAF